MPSILTLLLVLSLLLSAQAASHQQIDTTIRPVPSRRGGGVRPYPGANLAPFANLSGADLNAAFLPGVNLSSARLVNAFLLGGSVGSAFDDAETDFTGTGFDAVAAGWRLIPGPGAGLLIGLGLAGLAVQRR